MILKYWYFECWQFLFIQFKMYNINHYMSKIVATISKIIIYNEKNNNKYSKNN